MKTSTLGWIFLFLILSFILGFSLGMGLCSKCQYIEIKKYTLEIIVYPTYDLAYNRPLVKIGLVGSSMVGDNTVWYGFVNSDSDRTTVILPEGKYIVSLGYEYRIVDLKGNCSITFL